MFKCSICKENSLYIKDLDDEQNKCILHCKKTEKNEWFISQDDGSKDWSISKDKRAIFWKLFYSLDYYDNKKDESLIPPLLKDNEGELFIDNCTILDGLTIYKTNELSLLNTTVYGNILSYHKKEYTKLHFIDTTHNGNINIISGGDVDIFFKDIKVDLVSLGRKEKDLHPYYYNSIEIGGDSTYIKEFNMDNLFIQETFKMNNIKVDNFNSTNTIFSKKTEIMETKFIKSSCFKNARFEGLCDFYKTEFDSNIFYKTTFNDIVVFTESRFYKAIDFKYTTFSKLALFRNTKCESTINLIDSIFKEEANFLDMTAEMENRETARIIKNSFEQQNNIIEANRFYAKEMIKREKELEKEKEENYFEWFIFKVHGISSGHSQNPIVVLFWIFIIGFISATINFFSIKDNTNYVHINFELLICLIIFIPLFLWVISIIRDKTYDVGFLLVILVYGCYTYITKDYLLSFWATTLNPFSIMTGKEELTFIALIYKTIISYLLYQLIISIRQNTRRT